MPSAIPWAIIWPRSRYVAEFLRCFYDVIAEDVKAINESASDDTRRPLPTPVQTEPAQTALNLVYQSDPYNAYNVTLNRHAPRRNSQRKYVRFIRKIFRPAIMVGSLECHYSCGLSLG